jgi:fidgetin-like protein 1
VQWQDFVTGNRPVNSAEVRWHGLIISRFFAGPPLRATVQQQQQQQNAPLEFTMPVLQDDDAAMLHEDALLKYAKQRDVAQNQRQTGDATDDAVVAEMGLRLACSRLVGSLQYAAEAAHGINQATIRQLLSATRKQCDGESCPGPASSPDSSKLPFPPHGNLWSLANSSAPPDRSLANAFFDEYPEHCIEAPPPRAGSDDDDDDDDSVVVIANPNADIAFVKRVSPTSTVQTGMTLQTESQSFGSNRSKPPAGNDTVNPYCRSILSNHNDNGNRFLLTSDAQPSGENCTIYSIDDSAPSIIQREPTVVRPRPGSANERFLKQSTWEDNHCGMQQENPFQTAREYIWSGQNGDGPQPSGREPSRSHHNGGPPAYSNHQQPGFQQQHQPFQQGYNPYHKANSSPPPPQPIIRESLKRKFQPPTKRNSSNATDSRRPTSRGGAAPERQSKQAPSHNVVTKSDEGDDLPEELKIFGKDLVEKIENEIMESGESISFDQIAGLADQKQTVQEVVCWPMKRPDLFTGLRRAPNGLLLYGPPGTGKTLIGKAIAHESGATFFSISSSSLTSKWIGEGEKLVRVLFAVAAYRQPAVVFIDEIDSLLTQRKADENEASRRIKTEFLVCLDGTGTSGQGRVLVIGATNRPQELDEAARRRFTKRLYIPLPETEDREVLIRKLLENNKHCLVVSDVKTLAEETIGFSGADLHALSADAAMMPVRQLGARALEVNVTDIPPISYKHFRQALKGMKPSVSPADLVHYVEWDKTFGSKRAAQEQESEDDNSNT